MRYGFVFPGGDPLTALRFGVEAEAAGWDAYFMWEPVWGVDPWVTLGAVAARTQRIRLGTMLTPVSRRRPWKLASETATLDALSDGRVILSAGLGALETGFANFGEVTDRKTRAELLDEGLDIVTGLWRGEPFNYAGKHYHVDAITHRPPPPLVQDPHIPIWVVGAWKREKSMQRVLRYDGLLPNIMDPDGPHGRVTPQQVADMKAYVAERRTLTTPFDIVIEGRTPGDDPEAARVQVRPLAEAGATWWLEAIWGAPNLDIVWDRLRQGPPRMEG